MCTITWIYGVSVTGKAEGLKNIVLAWLKWKFRALSEINILDQLRNILGLLRLKDRRLISGIEYFHMVFHRILNTSTLIFI